MSDDSLDPCPYCGKSFPHQNAGARAQHVSSCEDEYEKYSDSGREQDPPQRVEGAGGRGRDEPAQTKPARREAGGDAPVTRQDAVSAGQTMGEMLIQSTGDSPEDRAEATEKAATAAGGLIASVGQRLAEQRRRGAERARSASNDDIQVADEYVTCPECDGQLTNLPSRDEEFSCDHCGTQLEFSG